MYVPAVFTVIELVVALLLHNKVPEYPEAVKTELPQLSTTLTTGASGIIFGVAITLPAGLTQPPTVCVTV